MSHFETCSQHASNKPATEQAFEVAKTPITRHFDTGAVRGEDAGRGKPSLLPFEALSMISRCFGGPAFMPMTGIVQVSKVYEAGAQKYEDRNWEKGIPFSAYIDSAMRHFQKFQRGDMDEPHCGQFAWNLCCLLQTYLWAGDGKFGEGESLERIVDLPLCKFHVEELRKEPLPQIDIGPLSNHSNLAVGSLFGWCYGKHPINLAAATAHAIMLCHVYYELLDNRLDRELDDMSYVNTNGWISNKGV